MGLGRETDRVRNNNNLNGGSGNFSREKCKGGQTGQIFKNFGLVKRHAIINGKLKWLEGESAIIYFL